MFDSWILAVRMASNLTETSWELTIAGTAPDGTNSLFIGLEFGSEKECLDALKNLAVVLPVLEKQIRKTGLNKISSFSEN